MVESQEIDRPSLHRKHPDIRGIPLVLVLQAGGRLSFRRISGEI